MTNAILERGTASREVIMPGIGDDIDGLGRANRVVAETDSSRILQVGSLAVKSPRTDATAERLWDEIETLEELSGQPNIVLPKTSGEWNGQPYVAFDYFPKGTLRSLSSQKNSTLKDGVKHLAETIVDLEEAIQEKVEEGELLGDGEYVIGALKVALVEQEIADEPINSNKTLVGAIAEAAKSDHISTNIVVENVVKAVEVEKIDLDAEEDELILLLAAKTAAEEAKKKLDADSQLDTTPPEKKLIDQRLTALHGVAVGLTAFKAQGFAHMDISKGNVLIANSGDGYVNDAGIAMPLGARIEQRTRCTDSYASPQRYQRNPPAVDPSEDVFGIGVLLYEALTDRKPWYLEQSLSSEDKVKVFTEEPTPVSDINADVSSELEKVVMSAIAFNPEDRVSIEQVEEVLRPYRVL